MVINCVSAVRRGTGLPPETIEELAGRDLVVQAADAILDELTEHGIKARVSTVARQEDVIRAVAEGRHDCGLATRSSALYAIRKNGWTNIVLGDRAFYSGQYGYAVHKRPAMPCWPNTLKACACSGTPANTGACMRNGWGSMRSISCGTTCCGSSPWSPGR